MLKKRWIRMLVCFVLVFCILVNISPIKAEATGIEVAVGISGVAVLAWAALSAAGVVFVPETVQQANALADSLQDFAERTFTTDEEWEEYKNYVDNFNNNFFNEPDAPDPGNRGLLAKVVGTAMGTALAGFAYGVIKDQEQVEVEEEVTAEEGYTYYNGHFLPDLSAIDVNNYPYLLLIKYGNMFYLDTFDGPVSLGGSYYWIRNYTGRDVHCIQYSAFYDGSFLPTWSSGSSSIIENESGVLNSNFQLIWSNYDIYDIEGKILYFAGSEPSSTSTTTVPVLPDTYVGDIPDQVKNGTLTAESLPLPDTFDLSSIVTSPSTAMQELTQTAQQLASGSTTYNDYITNITYVEDPEPETTEPTEPLPGTDTDPTTPSDSEGDEGGGDDDDEKTELEELEFYTLDLRDCFPFCIPFDIYKFLSILDAEPVTPYFEYDLYLPIVDANWHMEIDLAAWDTTALLLRRLELLLFIVGLAMVTRNNYIRG